MSDALERAEHYRDLARRYLRLAASTENPHHYLRIAVQYNTLADTEESCIAKRRNRQMSNLTRDEILAAVHPIDDATVAEIIATGADHDELVQACQFYARDRASRTPEDVPSGRVGRVVSILERAEAEVKETWLGEFGSTLQ
jgi:hypothetical protein